MKLEDKLKLFTYAFILGYEGKLLKKVKQLRDGVAAGELSIESDLASSVVADIPSIGTFASIYAKMRLRLKQEDDNEKIAELCFMFDANREECRKYAIEACLDIFSHYEYQIYLIQNIKAMEFLARHASDRAYSFVKAFHIMTSGIITRGILAGKPNMNFFDKTLKIKNSSGDRMISINNERIRVKDVFENTGICIMKDGKMCYYKKQKDHIPKLYFRRIFSWEDQHTIICMLIPDEEGQTYEYEFVKQTEQDVRKTQERLGKYINRRISFARLGHKLSGLRNNEESEPNHATAARSSAAKLETEFELFTESNNIIRDRGNDEEQNNDQRNNG